MSEVESEPFSLASRESDLPFPEPTVDSRLFGGPKRPPLASIPA